ncbi:unnamed protein product [Peniophora sp. CBMAI 1063]|nr:unnamed protein product [Peniophora sp. CBMAI 1063]
MSGLSSFLPFKGLGSSSPRERASDNRLRSALETMPGTRKYQFTPNVRAEILAELYEAFWGPFSHLFLPNSMSSLPAGKMLSEIQIAQRFNGAGGDDLMTMPGRSCNRIFKKGECCYRCKDCALDDSCVVCSRCFHSTDHTGHNVGFFIAQQAGGACDCGDPEAWKADSACPNHAVLGDSTPPTPSQPRRNVLFGREIPPVEGYPNRAPIPPELRETMSKTVAYALDFMLETLDYSPDDTSVPPSEADLRLQPTGDPMQKEQYCVVVWNDDKHSFTETEELFVDVLKRPREDARALVETVDEVGREVVEMGPNVQRLLDVANRIAKIELGVTVRRAYDTFREQAVTIIIEWLLDLTRSRLGQDAVILREIVAEEIFMPRRRLSPSTILPEVSTLQKELVDAARVDWLFLYHHKLWRRPRVCIKETYSAIIGLTRQHKLTMASHFASVYPRIIDSYLLVDREADTSIKYFALQLFTNPTAALHVVQHYDMISRVLSMISAFFTNQIHDKRILFPPKPSAVIDVEADPFKSKRFMPVFSDLRYLCHREPVQHLIAHDHRFITLFAQTCQLFMGISPNKRAIDTHVEFETDGWIAVFNVTLSLSRVIKVYGEAFSLATPAELARAISTIEHYILITCTLTEDRLDKSKYEEVSFHQVAFGERVHTTVNFNVLEGWVSFHHSLQWLLAEMFKHIDLLSEESLHALGLHSVKDILLANASERAMLTIIDFPLRVLTMVAQIRTGLWVRNGFAIRGQLLHYRDFMLRELCYDQDIYVIQMALIILDPDLVLVSILDRFQLVEFFSGSTAHPAYEGSQLPGMVEEMLYIIITILSEYGNAVRLPIDLAVRREIVHALAIGPCTFTDLVKRVAERLVDDPCFERVLRQVAHFRPPESTADTGTYELKAEMYDEVNPFFYHYSRNKREEVEGVLRSHYKKLGDSDHVVVPRRLHITRGPFLSLPSAFESEVLMQIIFYSIYNIFALTDESGTSPPSGEAILDQAIHLIMLALVERPDVASRLASTKAYEGDKNVIELLCVLEHHEVYKGYRTRCDWVLRTLAAYVPDDVARRRRVVEESPDAEDSKKQAARARQQQILAQMKAQQASFSMNFEEGDDDDDNMDDTDTPASFGTCIVCQEELNGSKPFGALGLVQPSRFIRRYPDHGTAVVNEVLQAPYSFDRSDPSSASHSFPPRPDEMEDKPPTSFEAHPAGHTQFGLHSSICSHYMHLDCFSVYQQSIRVRHRTQPTRNHPENIQRKEFICPLCKSLGNVILPLVRPPDLELNTLPFSDWTRAAGISILKSKADPLLESLLVRSGTGELAFWGAEDPGYIGFTRTDSTRWHQQDMHRMVDSVMGIARSISNQSRHLRARPEPEAGERGAGMYLPEDAVGYTIASLEISLRGTPSPGAAIINNVSESQARMIRGLVSVLSTLSAMAFKNRPDEGKEAMRQAIIKRLLPEWSLSSMNPVSYPLLLRDPFTILVETAAVAPEMLRHALTLTYYACLARTVIGLIYVLNKSRSWPVQSPTPRTYENLFGDLRMFFTSVVRHSPIIEHASEIVFSTYGDARVEKLMYNFTLPFLRRAAILCHSVMPSDFPAVQGDVGGCEYSRLLTLLGIPPLSDLPNQETLQTILSGWCGHYGHSPSPGNQVSNCGITLELPTVYRIARLPVILDSLFAEQEKTLTCKRCGTVPAEAAICLICGTAVCFQSHCCTDYDSGLGDRGECNLHAVECGGVIGMYFLVKKCSLLYLFAGNGTFGQSPYLDVHGEVDMSMRRGRRQFLHPARWEEVRRTWLSHGIPTLIARRLESTVDSGGWETM